MRHSSPSVTRPQLPHFRRPSHSPPLSLTCPSSSPTTHYLYQPQIQPCLNLIKPQQSITSPQTCTYNPAPNSSLPSLGDIGNRPPAARTGPVPSAGRDSERYQHDRAELSESSDSDRVRTTQISNLAHVRRFPRSSQPSFRSCLCHWPQAGILQDLFQPQEHSHSHHSVTLPVPVTGPRPSPASHPGPGPPGCLKFRPGSLCLPHLQSSVAQIPNDE